MTTTTHTRVAQQHTAWYLRLSGLLKPHRVESYHNMGRFWAKMDERNRLADHS